jgi:hypothetical protein
MKKPRIPKAEYKPRKVLCEQSILLTYESGENIIKSIQAFADTYNVSTKDVIIEPSTGYYEDDISFNMQCYRDETQEEIDTRIEIHRALNDRIFLEAKKAEEAKEAKDRELYEKLKARFG